MKVFELSETNSLIPTEYARGPFGGLQGGAIAALMCAELEGLAREQDLGQPISISANFLKATPFGDVKTEPIGLKTGGRSSTLMNTLTVDEQVRAVLMLSTLKENAVTGMAPVVPYMGSPPDRLNPRGAGAIRPDGPWLMDIFEVRVDPETQVAWFGVGEETLKTLTPFCFSLLVADWAHGINRPIQSGYADPNINLMVHWLRPPSGSWIGVDSTATWRDGGIGYGIGKLLDQQGEIGCVSMSVAVTKMDR